MIDEKASKEFKDSILLFSDCFSNIFVMVCFFFNSKFINIILLFKFLKESVSSIGWCEYGVTRALYSCLRYLTNLKHNWKYFQVFI
jgi:hypothetical protein